VADKEARAMCRKLASARVRGLRIVNGRGAPGIDARTEGAAQVWGPLVHASSD